MAITATMVGSFGKSTLDIKYRNYTGSLAGFKTTDVGYDPNCTYFVGYSFDATDDQRGSMTVNGVMINDSHTAGNGSFRKSNGIGLIVVGNGGLINWQGGGATGVRGNLKTFTIRIK